MATNKKILLVAKNNGKFDLLSKKGWTSFVPEEKSSEELKVYVEFLLTKSYIADPP